MKPLGSKLGIKGSHVSSGWRPTCDGKLADYEAPHPHRKIRCPACDLGFRFFSKRCSRLVFAHQKVSCLKSENSQWGDKFRVAAIHFSIRMPRQCYITNPEKVSGSKLKLAIPYYTVPFVSTNNSIRIVSTERVSPWVAVNMFIVRLLLNHLSPSSIRNLSSRE